MEVPRSPLGGAQSKSVPLSPILRQGRVRERWESPRVAFLVAARLFPRSQWIHCEPGIGGLLAGLSEPFPVRLSSFGGLVCPQDFQKFLNIQGGCEELKAKPEDLDSLWTGDDGRSFFYIL